MVSGPAINYCPDLNTTQRDPYRVFNVINQSNYYFIFVLFKTGDNQTARLADPGTWQFQPIKESVVDHVTLADQSGPITRPRDFVFLMLGASSRRLHFTAALKDLAAPVLGYLFCIKTPGLLMYLLIRRQG